MKGLSLSNEIWSLWCGTVWVGAGGGGPGKQFLFTRLFLDGMTFLVVRIENGVDKESVLQVIPD